MRYINIKCSKCGKMHNHSTMHDVSAGTGKRFYCSPCYSEFKEQPDESRTLSARNRSDMVYETGW